MHSPRSYVPAYLDVSITDGVQSDYMIAKAGDPLSKERGQSSDENMFLYKASLAPSTSQVSKQSPDVGTDTSSRYGGIDRVERTVEAMPTSVR